MNRKKIRIDRKNLFLGLMKKYKTTDFNSTQFVVKQKTFTLNYSHFKKIYTPLLSIIYIFEITKFYKLITLSFFSADVLKNVYYYANFNRHVKISKSNFYWNFFHTLTLNNIVVFSKPKKQIFFLLFKNQPLFIFTGGLMRIVMNEARKSSKKLYKVAVSLLKLAAILLAKKNYFPNCYLKLIKLGTLKSKILSTFLKSKTHSKIKYVIITFPLNFSAQKFSTRRSIKKYIRKRFKVK